MFQVKILFRRRINNPNCRIEKNIHLVKLLIRLEKFKGRIFLIDTQRLFNFNFN